MCNALKEYFKQVTQNQIKNFHFSKLLILDHTILQTAKDLEPIRQFDSFYIEIIHFPDLYLQYFPPKMRKYINVFFFALLTASWLT